MTAAAARRSSMRPLVHEPRKTVSTWTSRSGVPGCRPMYSRARRALALSFSSGISSGSGTAEPSGAPWPGLVPHVTNGVRVVGVEHDLLVEHGVVVAAQVAPRLERGVPVGAGRGVVAAPQVVEGRLVRRDHAGAGAGLDRHVAHRHPGFHRQRADGAAAVLQDVALAAAGADLRDDGEHDVLGGDAVGELAVDGDRHGPERLERQGLGGEHVLDLGGADAERERAERAVRRGVAVTADDGHARLGQPELRADDVHDALLGVAHRVDRDAELLAVAAQRLDLGAAHRVGDRARAWSGRCGPRSRG